MTNLKGRFVGFRDDDSGAQAVEFALIFLLALTPLILGLVQIGGALYSQITISQTARESARHLALNIINQAGCSDVTCDARVLAQSQGRPLNITNANVTITPCPPNATQGSMATVKVTAESLLDIFFSMTVTGSASMPCGG